MLQHEEREQGFAQIGAARQVGLDHRLHARRLEPATTTQALGGQGLAQQSAQGPAQPRPHRGAKTLLGTPRDRPRHHGLEGAAQQPLGRAAAQPVLRREGQAELDDVRVQQRSAGLEGHAHRGAVDLLQHAFAEIDPEVERGGRVEDAPCVAHGCVHSVEHVLAARRESRTEQARQLLGKDRREPARVPLGTSSGVPTRSLPQREGQREVRVGGREEPGREVREAGEGRGKLGHPAGPAIREERRVTGQEFVAAIASQRHDHLAPRDAREQGRR